MQSILKPLMRVVACGAFVAVALPAQAADIVTRAQDLGTLAVPQALTYGHAFNDLDALAPGLQLAGVPGSVFATDRFYDDYGFTISGSSFSAITATIDLGSVLGITNLQARLYGGTLQTSTTGPVGPALIAAWSALDLIATSGGSGIAQLIAPINLAPGNYVFEVRGNITGRAGGAYAGLLNVAAPIPEPGGLSLLFSGLGALGFATRRRAASR